MLQRIELIRVYKYLAFVNARDLPCDNYGYRAYAHRAAALASQNLLLLSAAARARRVATGAIALVSGVLIL